MGAGLRGSRRVLVAAAGGAIVYVRLVVVRTFFTFCITHMRGLGYPFCLFCVRADWCVVLDGWRRRGHDRAWPFC